MGDFVDEEWQEWAYVYLYWYVLPMLTCVTYVDLHWPVLLCYLCWPVLPVFTCITCVDLCYLCWPVLPVLICVTCVDLCYLCWLSLPVLTCYLCWPVLAVNILGKNCLTCIELSYLYWSVLPVLICVTCIDICYLWWPVGQAACVRVAVVPVFLHGYRGQQWRGGLSWQRKGAQVHGRSFLPWGLEGREWNSCVDWVLQRVADLLTPTIWAYFVRQKF